MNNTDQPCDQINQLIKTGSLLVSARVLNLDDTPCYLDYKLGALTLHVQTEAESFELSLNFVEGKSQHRRLYGGGKGQPLAKACGLSKHPEWTILDATAGLGKDAFVLASLGAKLTMCEQSPVLYALLCDALLRASEHEETDLIVKRMQLMHANAIDYLKTLNDTPSARPDVIYLDPMYPARRKSAKIKKEMQILQYLVGHSNDNAALLEMALHTAKHRVVVKRPKTATMLNEILPTFTVSSVNTRYDVYSR
ncbi:MAG: class I SAM-dependent methyltransferase [Cycloclasticus sp.]|nr:class I SAM-dependent methyltransferase [Cycloclasticus sp.]MBQ0789187.1 class I SAM-dependent methyltransferase [Cycloclasticus sp.]